MNPSVIPPLRALLADDERLARKRLRELLTVYPEIEVIGEADDVESTITFAQKERPDVIFLDIQMPPGSGFDVLPSLNPLPKIVFVTAHDAFAIRAFDANALDYILKPVHPDRLKETVRRLCCAPALKPEQSAGSTGKLGIEDLVTLRDKGTLRIVPVCEIVAIEAEGAYSKIILSNRPPMVVLGLICEWENRLPSPPFARLERSLLVNLARIRSVDVINRDESHLGLEGVTEALVLGRAASIRLRKVYRAQATSD
jgi:two-component system LytT family response regulator